MTTTGVTTLTMAWPFSLAARLVNHYKFGGGEDWVLDVEHDFLPDNFYDPANQYGVNTWLALDAMRRCAEHLRHTRGTNCVRFAYWWSMEISPEWDIWNVDNFLALKGFAFIVDARFVWNDLAQRYLVYSNVIIADRYDFHEVNTGMQQMEEIGAADAYDVWGVTDTVPLVLEPERTNPQNPRK